MICLPSDGFVVNHNISLREAMVVITFNRRGTVLVEDDYNRLVGVLSDGDIRRALLRGALMITPVGKVMNISVKYLNEGDNSDKVFALFTAHIGITILPVLNENRNIVGVYLRHSYSN